MFVSKRRYNAVLQQLDAVKKEMNEQSQRLDAFSNQLQDANQRASECGQSLELLSYEHEELKKSTSIGDECSVTVKISDGFDVGTPIVRWKETTGETLAEMGNISFNDVDNAYVIQIALIMIVLEMLEQMAEQFTEPPVEVE